MMFREHCTVLQNKKVAPGHFLLEMACPRISKQARPGQFVQILCSDSGDPLLPRPFSFLSASPKDFSVLYQVIGKGTKIMSQLRKGELLWVLGPLGNGFTVGQRSKVKGQGKFVLVGGGVGIPPLYHLAEYLPGNNTHVFLGARRKTLLLCERDFKKLGVRLSVATDDGSKGHKGFVTKLLENFLTSSTFDLRPSTRIYACGPTPMLKAVSKICGKYQVPCEVSVEVPMACGFGACIGCAVKVNERLTYGGRQGRPTLSQPREFILRSGDLAVTKDPKGMRYAMACVEGPVFDGSEIVWD